MVQRGGEGEKQRVELTREEVKSTNPTTPEKPDRTQNLSKIKIHTKKGKNSDEKVSVSTNWLQEMSEKRGKVIKSEKVQRVKKLKGDKSTKLSKNKITGFFSNISTFRPAPSNQVLGGHGSDENSREEKCPSSTVLDAIYQTAKVLDGSRDNETRRDEVPYKVLVLDDNFLPL